MFSRRRVKPSKASSLMGMIVGAVFCFIGVTTVMPRAGMFGVFWTIMAFVITGVHGYNYFSKKGIAAWEIETEDNNSENNDFESRIRKISKLKEDGLISEEEYKKKREEIMGEKW